tara:strand:- start:3218 stop:4180 length:963 start_codon:yes stop_codon:yes gene_type:complete
MTILSPTLLEKIEDAKSNLDERKLDNFVDDMFNNLVKEAIIFAPLQDEDNALRKDEVIKTFGIAWRYGIKEYHGDLDLLILGEIAGRLEPSQQIGKNKYAELRKGMTAIPGIGYVPPVDSARIQRDLDRLFSVIEGECLHPVEEAVLLYTHLVRIQPFEHANKRTANIVMNLILNHHAFPVIHIQPEEAVTYSALLVSFLHGFKEGGSDGNYSQPYLNPNFQQRGFYDFLGKKVLNELLIAHDYLNGLNCYEIKCQSKEVGCVYNASSKIKGWFKKQKLPHHVTFDRRKHIMTVVGDINYDTLSCILEKSSHIKYDIRTI